MRHLWYRHGSGIVFVAIILGFIATGGLLVTLIAHADRYRETAPCAAFASWSVSDVPARCIVGLEVTR